MRKSIFDNLSFWSLFLVITLLPFFFLPFTSIPVEIAKGALLVVGLTLCIIFWAMARFFDGKIVLPRSQLLIGGVGIILAIFLSTVFSKTPQVSFFGTMFDLGSFWFIFSAFLVMLFSSIVFRTQKQAKIVLFGAILASAIVLIFQGVRFFIPDVLSLGVFIGKTGNVLGSWNALGLFAGFSCLMSLLVIEFFSTTKIERWILGVLIGLSLLLIIAVNFSLVWILLGISSLVIFVYKVSISSKGRRADDIVDSKKDVYFPAFSFIVIIIALFFFISGSFVGNILPNRLSLVNNEVSPSFSSTVIVAKSIIKTNPIFGIGPNKFNEAWAMYKPIAVNATAFWNTSFNSGSGLLPTLISTTGLLGLLTWLIFFILLIISGTRSIFSSIKNGINWETMAFFVLALYLFVSSFFYSTGFVIFLLAFAFIGIFIGLSASHSSRGEISFSFLDDHRKSFFSMLFIIIVVIASAATSFKYAERFASVPYFQKSLTAQTSSEAITAINKALKLNSNGLYLRTYAQIYLGKFSSLANKGASLSETEKADLQTSLDQAVSGVLSATAYNPENYSNFQALGSVYQGLASFGVKDASIKAIEAYKTASNLNPLNPGIKILIASSSFSSGKMADAKEYANLALSLKPNYIDALVVLSQIAKKEGNNGEALSYARRALSLAPADENLLKYVDSLKGGDSSSITSEDEKDTDKKNP